jgi:hypothetical protein
MPERSLPGSISFPKEGAIEPAKTIGTTSAIKAIFTVFPLLTNL